MPKWSFPSSGENTRASSLQRLLLLLCTVCVFVLRSDSFWVSHQHTGSVPVAVAVNPVLSGSSLWQVFYHEGNSSIRWGVRRMSLGYELAQHVLCQSCLGGGWAVFQGVPLSLCPGRHRRGRVSLAEDPHLRSRPGSRLVPKCNNIPCVVSTSLSQFHFLSGLISWYLQVLKI